MNSYQKMRMKRICCFVMMIFLCVPALSAAQEIKPAQERDQFVRVYLTKLGVTDRLDLTLTTPYQLRADTGELLHFQKNSEVSFQLKNDAIYLYYQGMSQKLGSQIELVRVGELAEQLSGFYVTNFPALYLGDLNLEAVDGKLRPILTIHVEDYLLGVVPYEMGDSFPLEALKAQAVAARTYALRSQNQYDDYDVYDNTNDQVFKGYIAGNSLSEQAVLETQGVCGFYQNQLAQCFYSASNGGQTELVQNVWPSRENYPYYAFGDDPYDVQNPESTVRRFVLSKYYGEEAAPYVLRKLISEKLADILTEKGYDSAPESIRVNAVSEVSLDSPNMSDSKLMTMLHLALDISVRTSQEAIIRIADADMEEVSLFATQTVSPEPTATVVPESQEQTVHYAYGPFVAWGETVWLDIPVFPEAESVFGMDISSNYDNEIWSVVEEDETFSIEARRYGHGVGMSQRGAQVMAAQYGMNYQQIMAFYYPGMELKQYHNPARRLAETDEALSATAGPAPSPTPRPTLMPATMTALEGQWFATVTEIADDSSLNLRSAPSMNSDILMRLYKNQRLLVVERCLEDGWVHVITDAAEGYVMEKYLTAEES